MKKITRLVESTTNFQSERASVRSYISRRAEMSDGTTPLQKMGRNDDSRRYEKMRCTKTTAKTNTDAASGAERKRKERDEEEPSKSVERNEGLKRRIDWQPGLKDFYNSSEYDELAVEESARKSYQKFVEGLDSKQKALLKRTTNFYRVSFENIGGLVMPIILKVHYTDNTSETIRIPAEIWRSNSNNVSKLLITDKEISRLELDPQQETADTESSNNHWPPRLVPSRFRLFKEGPSRNPMQKSREAKKASEKRTADAEKPVVKKPEAKPGNNANKSPAQASGKSTGKAKPKAKAK